MAVNFGILSQAPTIGARFMEGQQAAAAEQERNMLRQMQAEQLAAQRENALALREQRTATAEASRAKAAQTAQRQQFLSGLSAKMAEGGYKLDRSSLGSMLEFGMQTGEDMLVKLATEGLRALDEDERESAELSRLGMGAAPAAPAAPVNAMAPAAAPVNTMAGVTREQVQQMLLSPSARVRERGKALSATLPKEAAAPAPSEVVKLSRELAEAQAAGNTALASSLQARIQRLTEKPVGAQTVIKLPEQERAEKGARGKLLVEQYQDVSKAASLAAKTLPAVETQERVLDSGFKTGFGTEVQKAGASVLAALGVPEAAKYATSAQTFLAATQQAVLQRQLEQKGPQTEADAQRITQTGAQLGNTPDANRFIISVAKAQLKRDIAQRNFYDKWWKEKGTYDGAEDAWFSGDGGKSLFDRPELKQYATKPAAPAGGGWRVVR